MIKVFKKNSGFSLVELIVACLVIAVLMFIAVPGYLNSRRDAEKQKGIYNLYAIYQAQKMIYFDQEPQEYANDIGILTPDYGEISEDDGAFSYRINNGGATFTATASHMLPDGTFDGYSLDIDETGSIDDSNWY